MTDENWDIIYKKYGNIGWRVYNLIKEGKTAEEILEKTEISRVKLVEIIEFLTEQKLLGQ